MGKPKTMLAKKLKVSYLRNGFTGAIVYGTKGMGKSAFALITMYDLYHNGLDYTKKQAWEKALDNTWYELETIIENLKDIRDEINESDNNNSNKKYECLHFDDAGAYFGGAQYNKYWKEHSELSGMMDTLRSATNGLILSCPNWKKLVNYITDEDYIRVKIMEPLNTNDLYEEFEYLENMNEYDPSTIPDDFFERVASVVDFETWHSGKRTAKKEEETNFNCRLPDDVYKTYMRMREGYFDNEIFILHEKQKEKDTTVDGYDL